MDTEEKKVEETQVEKTEEKAAEKAAPTVEELQKKIDELTRHSTNKEEEAARVQKKIEALEQAEKKRLEAELTKEQLAERHQVEEKAKADQAVADADKKVAEADLKLLKAAFLLKAKDMGFENPADAFVLANKAVTKKDDGEYDEASIEAALKPLIGRLPVKTQGDGKGTAKFPPPPTKTKPQKEGRAFNRPF